MKVRLLRIKNGDSKPLTFVDCKVEWSNYIKDKLCGIDAEAEPASVPMIKVKYSKCLNGIHSNHAGTMFTHARDILTIEPEEE